MHLIPFQPAKNYDETKTNFGLDEVRVSAGRWWVYCLQSTSPLFRPEAVAPEEGMVFLATLLKPRSRGVVELACRDPLEHPTIDPRYFEDPQDLEAMLLVGAIY